MLALLHVANIKLIRHLNHGLLSLYWHNYDSQQYRWGVWRSALGFKPIEIVMKTAPLLERGGFCVFWVVEKVIAQCP